MSSHPKSQHTSTSASQNTQSYANVNHINRNTMECNNNKCMENLKAALRVTYSQPKALFRALGVGLKSDASSDYWDTEENGLGIQIRIPKSQLARTPETSAAASASSTASPNHANANAATIETRGAFGGGGGQSSSTSSQMGNMLGNLKSRFSRRLSPTSSATHDKETHPKEDTQTNDDDDDKDGSITLKIQCLECGSSGPEAGARAYVRGPSPLSIVLCSNRLSSEQEIHQVLIHELIHVYDVHARLWDLTDCYTLAKSEVRAAREAECADASLNITKRFCVRDKAKVATRNIFPREGKECVEKIFEEAMADLTPFGTVNRHTMENPYSHKNDKEQKSTFTTYDGRGSGMSSSKETERYQQSPAAAEAGTIMGRSFVSAYSKRFNATTASPK